MAPWLDQERPPMGELVNFVRGDKDKKGGIAWENEEVNHSAIATIYGLGDEPSRGELNRRIVGDAGQLANMGDSYLVMGSSGACIPREKADKARKVTGEIVQQITGIEVKYS